MTQIAMTEIAAPLLAPFGRLLQPGDTFSVLSLASALACAVFLMRKSATGSLAARIETAFTKILPRGGADCPSCRLDVKLFLANSMLFAAAATWFGFSESMWRAIAHDGLTALVGARDPIGVRRGPVARSGELYDTSRHRARLLVRALDMPRDSAVVAVP